MRKRKFQTFVIRKLRAGKFRPGFFVRRSAGLSFRELPKFLTLRKTAEILEVHPNTLRSWDASGKLRAVRFGSRHDRRYLRDEVAALWTLQRNDAPRQTRWLSMKTIPRLAGAMIGAAVVLMVGGHWLNVVALADETGTVTISGRPTRCTGWTNASQAENVTLRSGAAREQYTDKNSAVIRMSDLGVTGSRGTVSADFDQLKSTLDCTNFQLEKNQTGKLTSVRARVWIATNGQANSTDTVRVTTSLNGRDWTPAAVVPVRRDDQGATLITVPAVEDTQQLTTLHIALEPDFTPGQTSWAAVDGIQLEATMNKEVAVSTVSSPDRRKELDRLTAFSQASYESTDQPSITVPKKQTKTRFLFAKKVEEWKLKKVEVFDVEERKVDVGYRTADEVQGDDTASKLLLRMNGQHPGKYQIRVTMISPSGTTETIAETFLWGVVAVNFQRASPGPGEQEVVGIGILDDEGRTMCNADVTVKIRDPHGRTTSYSTGKKTVLKNSGCVDKGITNEPDYHFSFTTDRVGTYHVSMKAKTEVGERTYEDNLFVVDNQAFDVQRVDYPTRINPYAAYPVRIAVTPRRDFSGPVYERVPENFKLYDVAPTAIIEDDPSHAGMQRIYWDVDWKKGSTYYLTYTFVAPPISPALFLTGPLSIGDHFLLGAEFLEQRQWQIASDSINAVSWDGSASSLWSNPANWSSNAIPQAGDNLVFPAGASNKSNTNDLGDNLWLNSITFNDSGYTLSGDTIILGQGRGTAGIILPGITDAVTSGGNTISLNLRFDATQIITVTNSGEALTIGGTIAGVGGLSKEGAGELILSGANKYGGVTKVNVGSLSARNSWALGTIALGTEVVGEAALELQGGIAIDREPLLLRGYGQSSSGALRNISDANSFAGLITIAGTTEIASDSGTLTMKGGVTGTFNLNLDGAGDMVFSTAPIGISSGLLTKNGGGTVTYNFPNTYTGLTTVNAGTLTYGVDNAILSGGITVNGGTVDIGTYSDMVGAVTLGTLAGGSGTITGSTGMLSSGAFTVYAGTISAIIAGDAGTLAKSTPGTVTLTRANQFTGAVTVTAGILKIQDSLALGVIDGITTVSSGASLQIDGNGLSVPELITISGIGLLNQGAIFNTTGNNAVTGLVTLAAASSIETATGTTLTFSDKGFTGAFALTFDITGDAVVSAPIQTGASALVKNGAGNLTLSAYNSYTSTTTINFGTLTLNGNGSIATSSGITTNSGAKLVMDNSSTIVDRVGDAVAVTMNGGDIDFYGSSSTNTLGILGALTMSGGQNTITVFAGTGGYTILRFASFSRTAGASGLFRGASLGATPGPNVATIRFTTAPTLLGDDDAAGTPKVSIIQGVFGDNSTSGTGTDMVTYGRGNNNGLRLLNGAGFSNEYTSDYLVTNANVKLTSPTAAVTTQINSLVLGAGASITNPGSPQTITFTSGNILNLETSGSIAGANTTLAGGSVEFILRSPPALDVSASITTSGGLTKSGTGITTFSTAKTYTGLTAVNAGTLLYGADNAISSGAVTVHDATLDIATFTDTVGAVVAQGGTITGTSGVLTATSYDFRASTISAVIGGSGTTTISNTNERVDAETVMTRENTYTGTTSIASGVLKLGGAGGATNTPLGTTAGATSITNGAMLDLNGYTLGTAEAINTFRGTGIAGQGAIINSSASSVTYSGALTIATSARIGADFGKIIISGSISGTGLPLTVGGFGDIDITGAILTGTAGSVVKDGFGTYTPSSASSNYTGATTINAGRLKLGGAGSGSNTPLGTVAGSTVVTNNVGASLDLNGYTLVTAEPLTVNGIGAGTGDFASGAVMNSGSSVTYSGTVTLGASSLISGTSGAIDFTSSSAMAGTGFTLTLGGSGGGTVTAAFTGGTNGAITKIDSGTWTLSGNSTYTGATIIYQGTIKLGATGTSPNSPLGTTGAATTVYSGGVLDLNGQTLGILEAFTLNGFGIADGGCVVNNSAGGVNFSGNRTLSSDIRVTNSGAGTLTWSGTSAGVFETRVGGAGNHSLTGLWASTAASVLKDGAGTAALATSSQGYTGNTYVMAGTFQDGLLNGLSNSSNLIVAGGTFDLSSNNADTVAAVYLIDGTISTSGGAGAILTGTSYTVESGTISGVLANTAATITKNTAGTADITGAILSSGAITVNAGTLTFSGTNGGAANVTATTINLGGTLAVDNTSANNTGRLSDTLVVTMNGGNLSYTGSSSTNASETVGQLAVAAGHNVVTVAPGTGGSTTLTFNAATSYSRTTGATVLFRGTSFGTAAGANVSTLVFNNTGPVVTGGGGASGTTTISIIRGAFGDNSTTGTGTDMVTYNVGCTNCIRLLDGPGFSGEYVTNGFGTVNSNVKITSNTAAATQSINSLVISGADVTNPGTAQTITTAGASLAGNILFTSANTLAGSNTTIAISNATEVSVLSSAAATISASIGNTSSGIANFCGPSTGSVTLSAANTYTSTTFINTVSVIEGTGSAISTGAVTIVGATFDLNGNSDSVGVVTATAGTIATGAGTLTTTNTFATVANANKSTVVTGTFAVPTAATFNIADGLVEDDAVVSAVVTSASTSLTKSTGTGVLVLSGNNTYTGSTAINAGTIKLGIAGSGGNGPLGTTAAGTVVGNGGAFDLNGITLANTTETLSIAGTGVSSGGALLNTKAAAVTYAGLLTLATAAPTIAANYGDISISNTGNITGTFNLTLAGSGNGSLASNLNISTGTLTKSGFGTWTLSGAGSTFTGAISITATTGGVLKLGASGDASNTPLGTSAGGIAVGSGAVLDLNGYSIATTEALTMSGTGIANIGAVTTSSGSATSWAGTVVMGAASRVTNYGAGAFSFNGNISGNFALTSVASPGNINQGSASVWSGTGTLVKEGSGTMVLAGQNSMTGAMTVSTGTLRVGASGGATNTPLGTRAGGITVSAGAVLDLSTFVVGGGSTWEPLNLSGTGLKNGGALISSASSSNSFGATTIAANSRVINSGSGGIVFTANITIANSINLGIGGTGPVTITGNLGASATSATLTKWDAGTLILAGATNAYTGLTRINGGMLQYGVANSINTGAVTVAGGTLELDGFTDSVGAVTLISGTISDNNVTPGVLTGTSYAFYGGAITAVLGGTALAMPKSTGDTLTIDAAITNTGTMTVNAGTVQYLTSNVLSNSSALTVAGGTVDIGANSDTVAAVTLTSGSILGSTGVLTGTGYTVSVGKISAILAGAVNLTKTTTGTVVLSGTNTYTGVTTIQGGGLSVETIGNGTVPGNLGAATNAAANIVFSTGTGTLIYTGTTASTDRNITTTTGITMQIDVNDPTATLTLAGATTNTTAPFTKVGAGTLSLSGTNLHTGVTTVLSGTLKYLATNVLSTGAVTVTNGTLDMNGQTDSVGTVTLTNGGSIIDSAGSTGVLTSTATFALQSGFVSAKLGSGVAAGISKTTTDRVVLTGDNTFTSTSIAVSVGKLRIGHNNALGASGTTLATTVTSGAVLETYNGITVPSTKTITLNGTGIVAQGALLNVSGTNTLAGAITLGATGVRVNSADGTLTCSGTMTGTGFAVTFGGAGNITYSGAINTSTAGTLTKDGAGQLNLWNANTYTGATAINAGVVDIQNNTSLGTTGGGVVVANGATLQSSLSVTVGVEALTLNGTGAGNAGALRGHAEGFTWQGAVTLASTSSISTNDFPCTISGTITGGAGIGLTKTGIATLNVSTVTIGGDLTISAGTLAATGASVISVGGSWSNSGTFTANSSTVSLTSNSTATITGNTTFNNLSIAGIGSAKTVQFVSGSTTTVSGTWTVTGASGQLVTLTRSGGANWNVSPTTTSIDYVDVSYSTNTVGLICATHSTSSNGGNSGWSVTSGTVCGVTVSGNIYTDDATTALNCSVGGARTVAIKLNGAGAYTASCSTSDGAFSTTVPVSAAGDVLTLFISGASEKGALVTLAADNSSNITGLPLRVNRLVVSHESAGPITNSATTGIGRWDKDDDATNLFFTANSNVLTVDAGRELVVNAGKTYTPGGTVTTAPATSSGGPDGKILIQSGATMNMAANALSVGGDMSNLGTLTVTSGQTTTMTATGTGFSVVLGAGTLQNVTFNGSGGGWTIGAAITVAGTFTVAAGSVTANGVVNVTGIYNQTGGTFIQATNIVATFSGASFTLANGTTWTKTSGTGKLIFENTTFTDNNSTKQNLGAVQIGTSPGTTTLASDMVADSVTIPTTDTLITKGYDITTTGAFDCQGTCTLDLTDTAPNNETDGTILDVGGDFTMSTTGTFTAHTGSKVFLNATTGNKTFSSGGKTYNDVELKNTDGTNDDITIANSPFDVNGTLTLTDGQVRLDTNDPNVTTAGNLSINANATVTKADNGTATWTFDGSGTNTWTDGTGSGGQDLGLVHINGTTKTVNLASSAKATKLIVAASQTFGLGSSGYTFTLTGSGLIPDHPFQNGGTLNEGSNSTFKYTGTADSDVDPESYNNLVVAPSAAGSPNFIVDISESGNPLDVTGTFVLGDGTNAVAFYPGAFSVMTVGSDLTIAANATFNASSDAGLVVGGSYLNNGSFNDSGNGVEFTATTTGKTIAGNITGANKIGVLIFNGSGGEWTNSTALETNYLAAYAGTFTGSADVTVTGSVVGTAGTINRTGGTLTTTMAGNDSFGPSTASTAWTFNNLTFSTSSGSQSTNTVSSCATCTYTVNGTASIGNLVTLHIAGGSWTVAGSLTTTSSGSITTANTPSVTVQGTAIGGGSGDIFFYNLTKSGASSATWSGSGSNAVRNDLTISGGTLTAPSGLLPLGNLIESGGTFTHNSGTTLFNSTTDETLAVGSTLNNVTINDGLVGYWNFDETSGTTANDLSGYGYNGTHSGTPTISTDVPTVNFTNDRSLGFNGSSQYVDMGKPDYLSTAWSNKISVSVWMKPTTITGDHAIVGQSYSSTHSSPFYSWVLFQSGSVICFRVGSTNYCSAGGALTTSWQHVSAVYDGSNIYVYVNGVQKATGAKTGLVVSGTQNIRVAARHTSTMGEYYSGNIDDVRVYRRNLSTTEVSSLAAGDQLETLSGTTYTLGDDLNVAGNLSIINGDLDVDSTNNYPVNVAGNWTNLGGKFSARSGTVTFNGGATGKTITTSGKAFNHVVVSGSGGGWTMSDATTVNGNLTLTNGALTAPSSTLTLAGDFSNSATFTHNSGTVVMTGTSKNITGSNATTFQNLQISGTTTVDAAGSDPTVASLLTVDNTKTLTIGTGRTMTLSGTSGTTLSLVGTITGAGRLTYRNTATAFPASGTISSILRMDATSGDQSIGGTNSATRTFGGVVEIYSNSSGTGKTVTLENGTSRTFTFSGNLLVMAENTQDLTLTADTAADPTVNVAGDMDFTGSGGGSEVITSGSGTWTVTGNVDFSGGTYTATSGNTLTLNGTTSTTINSACANTDSCTNAYLYNLTINKTDGADANDNVTLTSNGLRLANLLTITDGELIQGTLNVRAEGASAVSIASAGKWTNISTGDLKLGGTFVNAGTATLTSNNSAQCTDVADDIVISSTSGGSQRAWSGAGTFVIHNVNVTDMTGSVTAYTSTFTNTTWSVGSCGITFAGTVYQSGNEAVGFDCTSSSGGQLDLVVAVNGDVTPDTGICNSAVGTFSFSVTDPAGTDVPIALYIANTESEKATMVTLSASGGSNITGVSLILDRVIVSQQGATATTNSHLNTADNGNSGIRYTVSAGNLAIESGMELHVLASKTFTPGGAVATTATGTAAGPAGDVHIAGTLTMGTNTLTVGGDYTNAGTFNKTNTQSTVFTATGTGFSVTPGTGGMNTVTFSGDIGGNGGWTLTGSDLTVDGTLTVNSGDSLTIDTGRVLTNSGTTDVNNDGTITGAGILVFPNGAGGPDTNANSTGTYSSIMRFDASSGDVASSTVDARTYSGQVQLYANSASNRTITLASGTYTTSGASSHLYIQANGAGDLLVEGGTNSPTMNIAADLKLNGTGGGNEVLAMGDGTWTVSGNVDLTQGFTAPHVAQLNPVWDNFGYMQEEFFNDGFGSCDYVQATYSCGTDTSTSMNSGDDSTTGGGQSCPIDGLNYDTYNRAYLKYDLSSLSNTYTVTGLQQQVYVNTAGASPTIGRANSDTPNATACGSLYALGQSTPYNSFSNWGTGSRIVSLPTSGAQSALGTNAFALVMHSGAVSSINSTDAASNKPVLRVGYYTPSTTPTLIMDGTGVTLTANGAQPANFYNLTLSGTVTVNLTTTVYVFHNFDLSGTVTNNTAALVMTGTASGATWSGHGNTIGNMSISDNGNVTLDSDITMSSALVVYPGATLTVASGQTLTHSASNFTNNGTITGSGLLRITSASAGPGATGTLSVPVRYDATSGDIASTTFDARTYGGAVEFYSNSASPQSVTAPTSGTYTFSSTVTTTAAGAGVLTLDLDNTSDPTFTISGATAIGANTVLQAPSSTTLTLNGNYSNSGTFTDNSGTVSLGGGSTQTLSGTLSGSSDFNNLIIANTSGSESAPGVVFSAAVAAAGTFTANANTKLQFLAGSTSSAAAIVFNGTVGNVIYLRSSTPGTQWNFNKTSGGTPTITYTNIRDSYACGSSGGVIDASDSPNGTNIDATNNTCWFINSISMTLSDTTIGFGSCQVGAARYATGDTLGASSDTSDAHTITVATNARNGYILTAQGPTLTTGGHTITAIGGSPAASNPGSEQFGARVIKNSGTGTVQSPYNTANWGYDGMSSPSVLASHTSGVSTTVYGVRYICNITAQTEAGNYATDLTYVLTGQF